MEEELAATVLAQQYLIAELQETINRLKTDGLTWATASSDMDIIGHSYYKCKLCSARVIEEWQRSFECANCDNAFCRDCCLTRFCVRKKLCSNCWGLCPPKHRHQTQ
jgi:hypothetical protein